MKRERKILFILRRYSFYLTYMYINFLFFFFLLTINPIRQELFLFILSIVKIKSKLINIRKNKKNKLSYSFFLYSNNLVRKKKIIISTDKYFFSFDKKIIH